MTKQSKKGATPKGKQAPNTEKKTTKKVAPKAVVKEVKVVEKVVEEVVIEPTAETVEVYVEDFATPEKVLYQGELHEGLPEELKDAPIVAEVKIDISTPIQTPLTPSELEEKALEAHYASLGQIDFYNKNIKK